MRNAVLGLTFRLFGSRVDPVYIVLYSCVSIICVLLIQCFCFYDNARKGKCLLYFICHRVFIMRKLNMILLSRSGFCVHFCFCLLKWKVEHKWLVIRMMYLMYPILRKLRTKQRGEKYRSRISILDFVSSNYFSNDK